MKRNVFALGSNKTTHALSVDMHYLLRLRRKLKKLGRDAAAEVTAVLPAAPHVDRVEQLECARLLLQQRWVEVVLQQEEEEEKGGAQLLHLQQEVGGGGRAPSTSQSSTANLPYLINTSRDFTWRRRWWWWWWWNRRNWSLHLRCSPSWNVSSCTQP